MSYTAPAHDAADLQFSTGYITPASTEADFQWTDASSFSISCSTTINFVCGTPRQGAFVASGLSEFTPQTSVRNVSFSGSTVVYFDNPDRVLSISGSTTLDLVPFVAMPITCTIAGQTGIAFEGQSTVAAKFSSVTSSDVLFEGGSTAESAFAALGRADLALHFSFNKDTKIISRANSVCGFVSDTPRQGQFDLAGSSHIRFVGTAIRNAAFNLAGGSSFIARGTPLHTARMLFAGTSSAEFVSTGNKFSAAGASQFSPVFSSTRLVPTYEPTVDMCFVKSSERKVFVHTQ